ncbi:MAG: recombinase family protein [Elusimicrobia bacterium]|nr:recombinase family protein [Elusimicrobiota bacterium]
MLTKEPSPPNPTRCAIYTRVSTDQQAEVQFNSCEAQEDRIRAFLASQEGFVLGQVYTDAGFTGANLERPALQRLLQDIEEGKLDMVITYKIDRLTRSPRDFYHLIEIFDRHHVGFISVTERFDTSTSAGRLLRNIMLTFAQFERELISERTRDKIAQKAQRGLYVGGRPPLGYVVKEKRLVIDPAAAAVTKRVFETYVESRSLRKAYHVVVDSGLRPRRDSYGDSMVWHLLRNPVLTGKIIHQGKAYPGQHQPVIEQPLFDHVQTLLASHPREKPRPYLNMPYSGLIKCQECGSIMSASHVVKKTKEGDRRYYYYRCNRVVHKGWKSCSTRQINADRLHSLVEENLARISLDSFYIENLVHSVQNQTRPGWTTGVEPNSVGVGFSIKNLQNSLKNYNGICARKTGIEKGLLVQAGIKQVRYSKDSVVVDFYWERFLDGVEPSAAPARPAATPITERPTPAYESGSFLTKFDT